MGIINVLDKHTADLIAAGEVVERPASAIKEMMENSIDAGAVDITVEIKNGGITFMRITDNGCGILNEDVKKAFLPHATSKIKNGDDLNSILTLGFRGEALSTISSVAKVQMITKHKSEMHGSKYEINGGEEVFFDSAGCPNGTTIIVRDLFYNIPARMKFLKKDVAEGNAVSGVIDKIALSHPEVSITYIKDGKQILKTSGDGKLLSAIYSVYGRELSNSLLPVDYSINGITVRGFVSKPENARANRSLQIFFVNERFVKSRTAGAAVDEASKGKVMVSKFSSCVLHITVPPESIDVNVHPAKTEIRFISERPVFDAVYHAISSAFFANNQKKEIVFPKNETLNDINNNINKVKTDTIKSDFSYKKETPINSFKNKSLDSFAVKSSSVETKKEKVKPFLEFLEQTSKKVDIKNGKNIFKDDANRKPEVKEDTKEKIAENEEIKISGTEKPARFIGEAFSTYIIAEKNNEMIFIDKHAAHERIIFEKLKKENKNLVVQNLLVPITLTLEKSDYSTAVLNKEIFLNSGFDIDDFGEGVIIIRSAPQILENDDISNSVIEICGMLNSNKNQIFTEKMDWIFHNIACRAAIKAGKSSTNEELLSILKTIEDDESLKHCPHGRPITVILKKSEIEKFFGRM